MSALFTYGSLMDADILHLVLGKNYQAFAALLRGYRRARMMGQSYPAVVPAQDHSVSGTLYDELEKHDFLKLDRFEGEMYKRVEVDISSCHVKSAFVYVLKEKYVAYLSNQEWSFEDFLKTDKKHSLLDFVVGIRFNLAASNGKTFTTSALASSIGIYKIKPLTIKSTRKF